MIRKITVVGILFLFLIGGLIADKGDDYDPNLWHPWPQDNGRRIINSLQTDILLNEVIQKNIIANSLAGLDVNYISIDGSAFPNINSVITVDTNGTGVASLDESNFEVYEDGVLQTETVIPPGIGVGVRKADIIFIMDNSGSLGDEQAQVETNMINFVDSLVAAGVNAAFGLCRFGFSGNDRINIEDGGVLTTDVDYFKNTVWARNVTNGYREQGWEAMYESAITFQYRPNAQRIFILITDEDNDAGAYSKQETIDKLQDSTITLYALIDNYGSSISDYGDIADSTGGKYFDVEDPFEIILNDIAVTIGNTYVVKYTTTNPCPDGTVRNVEVIVDYDGDTDNSLTQYTAPYTPTPPVFVSHSTTYPGGFWPLGAPIPIYTVITDANGIASVELFYRKIGDTLFQSGNMSHVGGDNYQGNIPGALAVNPGVQYYIVATDSCGFMAFEGNVQQPYELLYDSSLPVTLASFTAKIEEGKVTVEWITESELNNLGFNLYKSLNGSDNFEKLNDELIEGAGSSSESHTYSFIDEEVIPGNSYTYQLEDICGDGRVEKHEKITINIDFSDIQSTADEFKLHAAYPNPFNPVTILKYTIPEEQNVVLTIYNSQGKMIETLVNLKQSAGYYTVQWNASEHPSGVYFYNLRAGSYTESRKCILIK